MIDKAFGLQVAVRNAVNGDNVVGLASTILFEHISMDEKTLQSMLFNLVAEVASMSSMYTAEVCLGDEGMEQLHNTIAMLQEMGNE